MQKVTVDIICAKTGIPSVDPNGAATLAVVSAGNVYTHSSKIAGSSNITLMYKATVDSGTPDIDLYLDQGPDLPTAEGIVGDAVDGWIQVGNKIADVTDELWHSISLSQAVLPYLRILCDGQGSNPASCKLALKLGKQDVYE